MLLPCSSSIERTVWDGDQVLHEIRAERGGVYPQTLENDASAAPAYGRVLYTHGTGIDHPLSVVRVGYTPTSLGAEYEFDRWGGPWAVIPLTDYRGTPATGTAANGRRLPGQVASDTCVLVEWPTGYRAYYADREPAPQQSWFGSLLKSSSDGSGLMYRRNRYYNPATGSFTQSDPIGLAGGLNTYGFADGDPVTYSDPFGLCPYGPEPCSEVRDAEVGAAAIRRGIQLFGQVAGATRDFVRNYRQMRGANTIGADKYFHCKANCEAARRGRAGAATARVISDVREANDFVKETETGSFTVEEAQQNSAEDQVANRRGRAGGAANPNADCTNVCRPSRPRGLPDRY